MATFRRYITIFTSFVVVWEVFFLLVADRHISSTSHHQGHGILPPPPPPGSLGGGFHRRPHQTAVRYTPAYGQFNTSHPPILYASSPGSLPSLPDSTRVPRRVLLSRNYTAHYSHWDPAADPPTLFVYNPSLVGVGSGVDGAVPIAAYLATFRVSSIHSCGFATYEFWKYPVDYVGVALLDADLSIATVEGDSLDIVVDINAHLPNIFGGRIKFQDVRLFVLHGRVFMSSGVFLVRICVKVDGLAHERHPSSPALCHDGGDTLEEIPALYRGNERLRLFVTGDALRMKGADGKNFQFFSSDDGGTSDGTRNASSVLMEYWPHGPRVIHDLGDAIAKHYASGSRSSKKRVVGVERVREITSEDSPDPVSKVAKSLDASLRTFIKRDRSSACCVRIPKKYYVDLIPSLPPSSATKLQSSDSIFVGIAHSKSRARMLSSQGDRYNYLSRLYAFSSSEPYKLLARSGLFCFGFAREEDAPGINVEVGSLYNERTKEKRLELNGKTYDCPNIHFVDSIIPKVGDRDKVIVSYGVNDCVPRFVEISKRDFVTHLFSSDPTGR